MAYAQFGFGAISELTRYRYGCCTISRSHCEVGQLSSQKMKVRQAALNQALELQLV